MKNITDRISLLEHACSKFPEGLFVEIGAASGAFTKQILATCPMLMVVAIDLWAHQGSGYEDPCNLSQETQDDRFRQFNVDFGDNSRVRIIRDWSHIIAKRFKNGEVAFIYLDANHSYEAVKQDLDAWFPKLAAGGIFAGHDYHSEVKMAVDEFCKDKGLWVQSTIMEYSRKEAVYGESWEGKSFYFVKP